MRNQFGLGRTIPEPVKRDVRQRCGYGCVVCGSAIIEYEHINPEFSRARTHDAAGITLLCPTCHSKKTRNFLSQRRVLEATNDPIAKRAGYAFSELEASTSHPYIIFAGFKFENCRTPIQIRGLPIFQIEDAEVPGGPFRISACFFDANGHPSLFIHQNEWQIFASAWDVEATGGVIVVRSAPGEIALRLRLDPGMGVLVERIAMQYAGYGLDGNVDRLIIRSPSGASNTFIGGFADNCNVGLSLD